MADENVIDDTDAEDNVEAQKALDDLTVLSNVGNQDMGAARLNNPRPVDVSEGALGGLANIHQGSETAPSVQEGLDVDVGAIEERGVTLESAPLTVAEAPPPAPEVVAQAEAPEAAPETAPRETVQPILAPAAPVFTPPTPEAVVDQPVVEQMPLPEVEVIDAPLAIEQTVPEAPVDELRLDLPPVVGDIRVIFRDEDPTDPTDPNVDPNLASFDLTGKEGHDIHFRIDAFDPDGGSVSINFSAGAHGFVAVDPQTGDYVYHPTGSNWYGDDTVTVYVRDDEGNVVSRAITINVANVDEVVNVTGGTGDESNNSNATVVTGSLATPETEGALSYAVVGNGEHHGSFSVNADGTFTFTAYDNNWNGTDTFTVEVVDDAGGVTQVPVTITVNAADDQAQVSLSGGTGEESTTAAATQVTGTISATDVDGVITGYTVVSGGEHHGSLSVNADGTYTFTANDANWNGTDTFTVQVKDALGGVTEVSVPVTVTATDDQAQVSVSGGSAAESTTAQATVVTGTISATDVDGAITSYEVVGGGEHNGSLSVNADGSYTFTANDANWNGTDTFTVQITDDKGGVTQVSVPVTVSATDDQAQVSLSGGTANESTTAEATQVTGTISATDVDGAITGYTVVSGGEHHGALSVNADGSYTFTAADANWNGTDTFTVQITDDKGGVTQVTVPVTVSATDDQAQVSLSGGTANESTTAAATQVTGTISATDVDGAITGYTVVSGGEHHGSLSVDAQGNFSFTAADANWNGTDTFTVQITDDKGGITEVTVPVTVSATDEIITSGGIVIDGSVANTVAIKEENPLTFSVDVDSAGGTTSVAFDAPAHGSVIVNDDGSYTYQPNDDFHGTDTLTYTVTDSEGGTLVKTVTVNVENVDDAATVIVAGGTGSESITNAATVVTGTISAADVDGAITGYTVVSGGEHHGSLSVDAQGNFSFTADDANWNGTDTFTVQIADALGGVTSQQVTINVAAADDATVVTGPVDVGHVAEDSSITFTADQLLAHASDVDSNLHVANVSVPGGALATNADGSYTFTPNADFNGTLAVSYDVVTQDGVVTHTTGTIEVDAVNDAPVITVVTGGTGTESTSNAATVVTGKVSATDVEGDSLSYSVVSDGTSHNGALSVDASGNFTFTAKDSSWAGDDSFTVRVSDGQGGTVDQTVNIHVDAVADTPTLFAEAGITHEGAQLDVGVQLGAGQTVYTASNDGGTNFGNNSGTMTVHASVPNGANPHTAGTFDVYVNNVKVGSGTASATPGDVTVTFNSNFQGFNDTDSLKISGSQGTNVHIDGITINGTEIDVGSGAKWKGAQVDSNGDTADIHNGGVIYSINDGNSGGTQTPSGTSYPLSLDLTGDASQYGVTVNNLPAGSELSYVDDSGQTITLTADAQGNVNLSAAQAQDVADHGAKLTTGLNVAVSTPTAEFHLAGANGVDTFVGGAGSDTITGTSHNDVIYGDEVSSNAGHYLVDLDISGGSTDTDGSETVTFSIGGVPDGVTLAYTDAAGVDHVLTGEGGTFSLTSDQLNGLHMIVPDDGSVTDFDLSVSSIAADGSSTASTSATLHVDLPELQAGAGDILNGGAGNDTVYGSEGNDIITGGAGADVLNGGAGNDSFAMGNGDDGTWGSGWSAHNVGDTHTAGTNQYVSVTSANQLDDTIIGGEGQDTLQGSSGNDAIFLDGNDGTARLQGIEVINAGAGNDVVDLTSNNFDYGNVTIDGGSGSDVLWASSGDDTLIGGSGADNLDGGAGTDTADFSGSSSGVNVYLGAGDGHGYGGTGGYGTGGDAQGDTYTGIENVVGSSHDDYIYGSASGSTVSLGAGNDTFDNTEVSSVVVSDTVDGGAGNDLIYTGNGDDVLKGGSGNDLLYGEAGNDVLTGGTGDDNLIGGSGDDNFLFDFGAGHDTVNGGTNWTDTIDLTSFSAGATITVNVDGGTDWTVTTDNADHATQLNPDESGTITVHVDGQEDTTIAFQNIEQVKW